MGAGAADGQLQSPGPSASWAPHGRLLTACLVALNVFLVLLVYVYFWRFLSRAPPRDEEDAAASSEDESSPPASPKARDRREVERAITALPVFVHSSSDSSGASAAECAICIAEFADGEEGRLLPRCGHRFHARCVDTWFRFHATCPLCRDTVLHVAGDTTDTEAAVTTTNRSSDTDSADCPV